jgi:putative toxin-antitoxin system antitoxin component (TIGR02293 family)
MKKYPINSPTYKQFEEQVATYEKGMKSNPTMEYLISQARNGLKFSYAIALASDLGLSFSDLAIILHMSLRTLQRYEPDRILDSDHTSKMIQLTTLRNHGIAVFGDQDDSFAKWLKTELPALKGNTPLSFLDTPFGFDLIHQVLGRIEHGILS